ncbi:hypothetical protein [Novosphingobium sp. HII-3]|uniref:hypothetical protein n=1 Tax=Novosphingobium sp. HII-3 TaxID=2075565 RepID=UPI000CDB3B09|nr:hypothetical protein [Novosphingobium sp. HII-3]
MTTPILEQLEAMGPDALDGALLALDTVSRPLTVREIEAAMLGKGVSRSQRKIISKAIERLHIIAVVGPEHG